MIITLFISEITAKEAGIKPATFPKSVATLPWEN